MQKVLTANKEQSFFSYREQMKRCYILFCFFIILILSCKKDGLSSKNDWQIDLPETKIPQNISQWAINKYPFIKLRMEPTEESKIIYYLPIGAIIKIIKKDGELSSFDNENNYWYNIDYEGETGWIFGSFIEIFNSYEEALKRSEEIILGDKK